MTRDHNSSPTSTTPKPPARRILPLPEDVVAQIKSATTIVSLTGVVLELLKNSLDAKATRVDATVDFVRGACTVDDDGLGISPLEFKEDGCLAKTYCTSKYDASEALLGRHGTFLASLAAMSLLTITSHHRDYRSTNSVTLHHSKVIRRQLPASNSHGTHGKHGTCVTVRNLFGNLPVRVKQRAVLLEQRAEQERLWEGLKRAVTGLLLSWQGGVSLKIRDGGNREVFSYNTPSSVVAAKDIGLQAKPRSAQLTLLLNVLTQSGCIGFDDWAAWIPASASTPSVSIKGAISLDPAPSKQVQYISLGNQPLLTEMGHNELYDEVNRLFAMSNFGYTETGADIDDLEKTRHQGDKRLKHDQNARRPFKTRKDVDRHPMFHLCISLKEDNAFKPSFDHLASVEATLPTILEILRVMITQWLSAHDFCPRKAHKRQARPGIAATSAICSSERDTPQHRFGVALKPSSGNANQLSVLRSSSMPATTQKRKSSQDIISQEAPKKSDRRAFAQWSRIKTGKAAFFDRVPGLSAPKVHPTTGVSSNTHASVRTIPLSRVEDFNTFHGEPLPRGALSLALLDEQSANSQDEIECGNQNHENTILWTDPSSKKTFLLNARTGIVMPNLLGRPNTDPSTPSFMTIQRGLTTSMRLVPKSANAAVRKTPFLDNVLQAWNNPIFKPSEKRIQQAFFQEPSHEPSYHRYSHQPGSSAGLDQAFDEVGVAGSSKLSRDNLQCAEVIAQVDKKFILVKMAGLHGSKSAKILVLVDQHAADERIQVEALLQQFCTPTVYSTGASGYRSKLGHRAQVASILLQKPLQFNISSTEATHFTTHAARFAAWGILFEVATRRTSASRLEKTQSLLSVTSLSPIIVQRCKADPQLLISFLRTTVWTYVEDGTLPPLHSQSSSMESQDWVRRLATCPPGLIDMINSRACRSAIMFNDELSMEECRDLVEKLGKCTFPFMCAHGRPSMVPLVDISGIQEFGKDLDESMEDGFAQRWKTWRSER